MPYESARTLIVGAGPAGLATAAALSRRGLPYVLVERGPTIGHTWEHLYESLTLHTGRHMSTLPGMPYPRGTSLFPTRLEFLDYLRRYVRRFQLAVTTGAAVQELAPVGAGWRATLGGGDTIDARDVVMTTGIVAKPRMPALPGRDAYTGRVMHSVAYQRPEPFVGRRVLVVGVGNSGGEIGTELARAGALVTVSVRSGVHVVPRQLGPFPAQYLRYLIGQLPRRAQEFLIARVRTRTERRYGPPVLPRPAYSPLDAIPMIGFGLVDCIREGVVEMRLAAPESFTETGVRFADGTRADYDVVMFATGFAAAIDALGSCVRRDRKGWAIRRDRVASADQAHLYFVGHNYDHTGGLTHIRRDAELVAKAIGAR